MTLLLDPGSGRADETGRRGPVAAAAIAIALVLVVLATLGTDLLDATGAGTSGAGSSSGEAGASAPRLGATALSSPGASSPVQAVTTQASSASAALAPSPAEPSAGPTSPAPESTAPASAAPAPSAPPSASQETTAPASATPRPSALRGAAPTSARGFRPTSTVVAMAMPFRPGTAFTFGDGFRRPRDGVVYPYNLIRGVAADGTLLRAHDGQDLLVPIGTLVVAPLGGLVVDPSTVVRPWDPARYGKVIAIRSTEATSPGYVVIMAHLSRQSAPVGTTVRRGQVVGRTGRSGNALESLPHLHIEIRAPFPIRYGYGGVIRWLDAFDILPSLKAASRRG
jgi:murein DD-endopeptidase MepM/ murein hydrolase activator NlpD